MKLIIDIPAVTYEEVKWRGLYLCPRDSDALVNSIKNGTLYEERPHGEWIPCSERLPEEQGQYYVSGGDKVWICDFLIFSNLKGGWCNNVSNPVVEAWMPLPEPYKEEGEAE